MLQEMSDYATRTYLNPDVANNLPPFKQCLEWGDLIVENTRQIEDVFYGSAHYLKDLLKRDSVLQIVYLYTALLTFFLSLAMPFIKNPTYRKIYSTFFGFILSFYFNGVCNLL